jgi:peptidoglycan/xylan/chitin deacetylase (PgdA/CDA1 family)
MSGSKLITFGSHTFALHKYVKTNPESTKPALIGHVYNPATGFTESEGEYINRITKDLQLSKKMLEEKLNEKIDTIAFPYGASDAEVVKVARELGFDMMFSVKKGIVTNGDTGLVLPRVNAGGVYISPPVLSAAIGDVVYEALTRVLD